MPLILSAASRQARSTGTIHFYLANLIPPQKMCRRKWTDWCKL